MNNHKVPITASMLYSLVTCEHRPWMDLYADPALRDEPNPFLEMLWRRGRAHEEEVISADGVTALNLRIVSRATRESETIAAMQRRVPLIYGGHISSGDLLGEPDLLRHIGDGKYVPGDIKSGAGEEGSSDERKKPKKHYGVQLALYVDILERIGLSDGKRQAFVWDVRGDEVGYDLTAAKGKRTPESLWDDYQQCLTIVREIISGVRNPGPSFQGECRNCVWLAACIKDLESKDDLSLLPGMGRSTREPLLQHVRTIREFAQTDPSRFLDDSGKSIVPGMSAESVAKFHARAGLCASHGEAYLRVPVSLPTRDVELFFDIETDPMSDHCYLHGFVERRGRNNSTERYLGFFSKEQTAQAEREAFAAAWQYVQSNMPCVLYIYSKYERTWWRALQAKYPDVCGSADIEALFSDDTTVDLLATVQACTVWPTRDHTIKTLAKHLGFSWRDAHPSGAASIEWYDRYVHGDDCAKARILEYNEDDCRATRVLLDGIRALPILGTCASR